MTIGGERGPDPFIEFTDDADAADLLRRNLTALADQYRDAPLGQLVQEVLSGRRPVRDLESDPEFATMTRSGVREFTDYLSSLTPEERQRLTDEAQQLLDDRDRP